MTVNLEWQVREGVTVTRGSARSLVPDYLHTKPDVPVSITLIEGSLTGTGVELVDNQLIAFPDAIVGQIRGLRFSAVGQDGHATDSGPVIVTVSEVRSDIRLDIDERFAQVALYFTSLTDPRGEGIRYNVWHSVMPRSNGTVASWGAPGHGGFQDNSVKLLLPDKRQHVYFTENTGPSGVPVQQYDNLNYFLIQSEDLLVIPSRGAFDFKANGGKGAWTHGSRSYAPGGVSRAAYEYWAKTNGPYVTGTTDTDLIRWEGTFDAALDGSPLNRFNQGTHYVKALDLAIIFGGPAAPRVWFIERNRADSPGFRPDWPNPWRIRGFPTDAMSDREGRWAVGGIRPIPAYCMEMRDMVCSIGRHVYFVSPKQEGMRGDGFDPRHWYNWFWRIDAHSLQQTGDPKLTRLADAPAAFCLPRTRAGGLSGETEIIDVAPYKRFEDAWLCTFAKKPDTNPTNLRFVDAAGHDYYAQRVVASSSPTTVWDWVLCKTRYSSSGDPPRLGRCRYQQVLAASRFGQLVYDESAGLILFFDENLGIAAYDPHVNTWHFLKAPAGEGWTATSFSQAAYVPQYEAAFFQPGSSAKSHWSRVAVITKKPRQVAQGWKVAYPEAATGKISYRGMREKNPINFLWTNKHHRFCNHGGRLYQIGGDHAGFPYEDSTTVPGYPPTARNWNRDGARQDFWMCSLEPDTDGHVIWELSQNWYHDYPYVPGRLAPANQRGPRNPDGIAAVVDKRGDVWLGIGGRSSDEYSIAVAAGVDPQYDMRGEAHGWVYRWRLPGTDPKTGIRLGNGYWKPLQNRLRSRGAIDLDPPFRADYDISMSMHTAENCWMTYDPVRDELVVVWSDRLETVNIYRMPVKGPTNKATGEYLWTRTSIASNAIGNVESAWENAQGVHPRGGALTSYGEQQVVDRHLYAICVASVYGPEYTRYKDGRKTNIYPRGFIVKVNLDTNAVDEWIQFPTFFCRGADVMDSTGQYSVGGGAVLVQFRGLAAVNRKLVLGPTSWSNASILLREDNDPLVHIYDVDSKRWSAGEPFDRSLNPDGGPLRTGWGGLASVPERGEVWIMQSNNLWATPLPHIKYRIE